MIGRIPDDDERALEVLTRFLEDDPADVVAFLDRACQNDPDLRTAVEDLLDHHARSDRFLSDETGDALRRQLSDVGPPEFGDADFVGAFDKYQVIRRLGEGTAGVVYLAEQGDPIPRRVALKVLKGGSRHPELQLRFETEVRALAFLEHPSIARIYDAGTRGSDPYFVMEYVAGPPIDIYCDEHRLSIDDRLRLFVEACWAVEHANGRGVVHRDLKPSNILVCEVDGWPVTKIIDFGIAKAISGPLSARALQTELGLIVGTPAYMSPEQASGGAEIDARSDVYSLGVVLFELLVGVLPHDWQQGESYTELLRRVADTKVPTPSHRLDTLSGQLRERIAEARTTTANELRARVSSDLGRVVTRALELEPERRYSTAGQLAGELREVMRRGRAPLIRRQSRRRRATISVLVLLLVAGAWVAWNQWRTHRSQRAAQSAYVDAVRRVADRIETGKLAEARRELASLVPEPGRPDQRSWEWYHYDAITNPELALLVQGSAPIAAVAYSADGGRVLAARHTNADVPSALIVMDAETGDPIWTAPCSADLLTIAGSTTVDLVAGWCANGVLTVWNTEERREVASIEIEPPADGVPMPLALSRDGRRVACVTGPKTVRTFAASPALTEIDCRSIEVDVIGIEFTADDELWISTVRGKEGAAPPRIPPAIASGGQTLLDLHASPDPSLAVGVTARGPLIVYERETGTVQSWLGKLDRAPPVTFVASPDGQCILAGYRDGRVIVYDWIEETERMTLRHDDEVTSIAVHPHARRAVSASRDGTVRLWDLTRAPGRLVRDPYQRATEALAYGVTGPIRLDRDGVIETYDRDSLLTTSATSIAFASQMSDRITTAAFSPDAESLVFARNGVGPDVVLWSRSSGTETRTFTGLGESVDNAIVCAVAISSANGPIAAACFDRIADRGELAIWDARSGRTVLRRELPGECRSLSFDHAGRQLACSGHTIPLLIIDVESQRTTTIAADSEGYVAFHPDGHRVAFAGEEETWIADARTGERLCLCVSSQPIRNLAFHPDGSRLAGTHRARTFLWDAETGRTLVELSLPNTENRGDYTFLPRVAFDDRGEQLVVSNWKGDTIVFQGGLTRSPTAERLARAQTRATAWHSSRSCVAYGKQFAWEFHLSALARNDDMTAVFKGQRSQYLEPTGDWELAEWAAIDDAFHADHSGTERWNSYHRGLRLLHEGRDRDAAVVFERLWDSRPHASVAARLAALVEEHSGAQAALDLLLLAFKLELESPGLWRRWFRVATVELKLSPVRAQAQLPETVRHRPSNDVQWALDRMRRDGAIRINCAGPDHTDTEHRQWAADRFGTYGVIMTLDNDIVHAHLGTTRMFIGCGRYSVPVPIGTYDITVFASPWFPGKDPAQNSDIRVEGEDFVEGTAAVPDRLWRRTVRHDVTDGFVDLEFLRRRNKVSWVTAFEIVAVD